MGWAKKTKRVKKAKTKRVPRGPKTGGFLIRRRVPAFGIQGNNAVANAIASTNTMLTLGATSAAASGGSNLYDIPFSMEFRLFNLDTYTDVTGIADRYKILKAVVRLQTCNAIANGQLIPWVEYIEDHDDAGVPSISGLTQKMGVKTAGFNQRGQLSITCRPRPAVPMYDGVANLSYLVPSTAPYINTAYPSIPHYAIKGVLRSVYLPGNVYASQFAVDVEMTVSCRDLQ